MATLWWWSLPSRPRRNAQAVVYQELWQWTIQNLVGRVAQCGGQRSGLDEDAGCSCERGDVLAWQYEAICSEILAAVAMSRPDQPVVQALRRQQDGHDNQVDCTVCTAILRLVPRSARTIQIHWRTNERVHSVFCPASARHQTERYSEERRGIWHRQVCCWETLRGASDHPLVLGLQRRHRQRRNVFWGSDEENNDLELGSRATTSHPSQWLQPRRN